MNQIVNALSYKAKLATISQLKGDLLNLIKEGIEHMIHRPMDWWTYLMMREPSNFGWRTACYLQKGAAFSF